MSMLSSYALKLYIASVDIECILWFRMSVSWEYDFTVVSICLLLL